MAAIFRRPAAKRLLPAPCSAIGLAGRVRRRIGPQLGLDSLAAVRRLPRVLRALHDRCRDRGDDRVAKRGVRRRPAVLGDRPASRDPFDGERQAAGVAASPPLNPGLLRVLAQRRRPAPGWRASATAARRQRLARVFRRPVFAARAR